ncbi:hypothetical protein FB451DRAFT_1187941 [Mycena latifolia]|nr:hypothetical protein FB451DRAFT_1187941 [Mycena latifolia]
MVRTTQASNFMGAEDGRGEHHLTETKHAGLENITARLWSKPESNGYTLPASSVSSVAITLPLSHDKSLSFLHIWVPPVQVRLQTVLKRYETSGVPEIDAGVTITRAGARRLPLVEEGSSHYKLGSNPPNRSEALQVNLSDENGSRPVRGGYYSDFILDAVCGPSSELLLYSLMVQARLKWAMPAEYDLINVDSLQARPFGLWTVLEYGLYSVQ